MNTSNDTEMYDYDYNSTCNGDPSAQSAFEATLFPVLYYTLSLLGMIGRFKKSCPVLIKKTTKYISSPSDCWRLRFGTDFAGNATILWVLLRYIKLKTMTDICLLNLVLSDLILAASLPLWAYTSQNLVFCKLMTAVYQVEPLFFFLNNSYCWGHSTLTSRSCLIICEICEFFIDNSWLDLNK